MWGQGRNLRYLLARIFLQNKGYLPYSAINKQTNKNNQPTEARPNVNKIGVGEKMNFAPFLWVTSFAQTASSTTPTLIAHKSVILPRPVSFHSNLFLSLSLWYLLPVACHQLLITSSTSSFYSFWTHHHLCEWPSLKPPYPTCSGCVQIFLPLLSWALPPIQKQNPSYPSLVMSWLLSPHP